MPVNHRERRRGGVGRRPGILVTSALAVLLGGMVAAGLVLGRHPATASHALGMARRAVGAAAAGDRSVDGVTGTSTLPTDVSRIRSVVVLGHSVTTGSTCDCTPFGDLVAARLSSRLGHRVAVTEDGVDGSTVRFLRQQLEADDDVRTDVRRADLVLVTTGANDLLDLAGRENDTPACAESCFGPRARSAAGGVGGIVDRIRGLNPDARIVVTDYWNVFTDGDSVGAGTSRYNRAVTQAFDDALHAVVSPTGATWVDLVEPFSQVAAGGAPLLLADGDHPSAAGHRRIAEAVLVGLGASGG